MWLFNSLIIPHMRCDHVLLSRSLIFSTWSSFLVHFFSLSALASCQWDRHPIVPVSGTETCCASLFIYVQFCGKSPQEWSLFPVLNQSNFDPFGEVDKRVWLQLRARDLSLRAPLVKWCPLGLVVKGDKRLVDCARKYKWERNLPEPHRGRPDNNKISPWALLYAEIFKILLDANATIWKWTEF